MIKPEISSFRDPDAKVFYLGNRIIRALSPAAKHSFDVVTESGLLSKLISSGLVVATRSLDEQLAPIAETVPSCALLLEHEKAPFVSYPYEWPFEMLRRAALTHLEINKQLLEENLILKDSSAYNYQFFGSCCKLIDVSSISVRRIHDPWLGYTQFCRHFLYPLVLASNLKISTHLLLRSHLEGIPAREASVLLPLRKQVCSGAWPHLWLKAWLDTITIEEESERKLFESLPDQKHGISRMLDRLTRLVERLPNPNLKTIWSEYETRDRYSAAAHSAKRRILEEIISKKKPKLLYDFGANNGEYGLIAAEHADYVVAFDADPSTADPCFLELVGKKVSNVLPLIMDLTNPSPDQGFGGRERQSLERRGKPDFIMVLALMHHLRIRGNIPFRLSLEWLASFTASDLLIEYVPKEDPMVQQLLKNQDDIFNDYSNDAFETECSRHFTVVEKRPLPESKRCILWLRRK